MHVKGKLSFNMYTVQFINSLFLYICIICKTKLYNEKHLTLIKRQNFYYSKP